MVWRTKKRTSFNRFMLAALIIWVTWSLTSGGVCLAEPTKTWEKTLGGVDSDSAVTVFQTGDGGYIMVGSTSSSGAGGTDAYLVKTDADGEETWSQTYGGAGGDYGRSMAQTSDGGYVITGDTWSFGAGLGDVYLVKTDATGAETWLRTYGGAGRDEGWSVAQTSDGGYIIAGYTNSLGAGNYDVYLVKTDGNGIMVWEHTYGGAGTDYGYSVVQTSDGGYIIAGLTTSFGAGNTDMYLIKTDFNGAETWSRTYGGDNMEEARSVIRTGDDGYLMTGYTRSFGAGSYDVYLVKVGGDGGELWSKTYGGAGNDMGQSVVETNDGGYIIAAYTTSSGAGSYDAYIVKTNFKGIMTWSQTYGGADVDRAMAVDQTADDGYIITGHTASSGAGSSDIYLIRLDQPAQAPAPASPSTHTPNPGRVFLDRGVNIADCVKFHFSLRDINWTTGEPCFSLTITDSEGVVYSRECGVRKRDNWYVWYLNRDRFTPGVYEVEVKRGEWVQTKTIQTR